MSSRVLTINCKFTILEMFQLLTIWSKPTFFANLKDELGFPQIAPELCDISEMFFLQDWETGKTSKTFSFAVCVKGSRLRWPNVQRAGFAVTLNKIKYHAPLEIHPFHP